MPRRKSARNYKISHSIIVDKYKTNDRNMDEISIVDHRNKLFRNLQLTEEKVKGKLIKNKIQYRSSTRPKEVKTGSFIENSLDSKQYCLRNRFSSIEIGNARESLSTHSSIKSNQHGSSSNDTTKNDISTKTYRENDNVSDELDKNRRSGRKKLVSTFNKNSTSKICNRSQKQIKLVSFPLRAENIANKIGESETTGINVLREQDSSNNIKCSDDIAPSGFKPKMKREMNPYVDMSKHQLDILQADVRRSQRNVEKSRKRTGESGSSDYQGNYSRYPSCDKNQRQTPTTLCNNNGKTFVIPPKNVNKRQKIDTNDKAIFKSDVKPTKAVMASMDSSFDRSVTNDVGERSDMDRAGNSGMQQKQCLKLPYARYISIAERILKNNGKLIGHGFEFN